MDNDAVGTRHFNESCSGNRVRVFYTPRFAKGGYVINIDS
jgi:hypothetical protein